MTKEFKEITAGLEVLEIPGWGVLARAKSGASLHPLEGVVVSESGELVADGPAMVSGETTATTSRKGPASQAEINVNGFLKMVQGPPAKTLSVSGEYGASGPIIGKLKDLLLGLPDDDPRIYTLGTFLARGDHGRYNFAAAIFALDPEGIKKLEETLANPTPEAIEAFVG